MEAQPTSSGVPPDPPSRKPPTRRVERWIALAIAVVLGFGVCLIAIPREIARWYRAAAEEAFLDGDEQRAKAHLDKAVAWSPSDPDLLMARSAMLLQIKEFEASLQDCDRALELVGQESSHVLSQRLSIHQRMDQHDLALADADRLVESAAERYSESNAATVFAYANALNARAYARALANRDLAEGLEDIQQTFELLGTEDHAAYLDTRGYLYFLAGDLENAERDMERSVRLAEDDRSSLLMRRESMLQNGIDARQIDLEDESLKHQLAVLYQHRGLVYEALGQADDAARDFRLADEFGYSPEDGIW